MHNDVKKCDALAIATTYVTSIFLYSRLCARNLTVISQRDTRRSFYHSRRYRTREQGREGTL